MRLPIVLSCLLWIPSIMLLQAADPPRVVRVDALPEGFLTNFELPSVLNDSGTCVGFVLTPNSKRLPAVTGLNGQGLTVFPAPTASGTGELTAINSTGFFVGAWITTSPTTGARTNYELFFGGGPENLPLQRLPLPSIRGSVVQFSPKGLSDAGDTLLTGRSEIPVAGGFPENFPWVYRYNVFTGVAQELVGPGGNLGKGGNAKNEPRPRIGNASGQWAGSLFEFVSEQEKAARWDGVQLITLGYPGVYSVASGINKSGDLTGWGSMTSRSGPRDAFLYRDGALQILSIPPLPDARTGTGESPVINDRTQIVLQARYPGPPTTTFKLLLHEQGVFHDIGVQLPPFLAQTAPGFTNVDLAPYGLNNSGQILVRGGTDSLDRFFLVTLGGENTWLPENGASESFFTDANWSLNAVPQVTDPYFLPDTISTLLFDRSHANTDLTSKEGGGHTFNLAGNFYSLKKTLVEGGSVVLVDGGGTFDTESLDLGQTGGNGEFKVIKGRLEVTGTAKIGGIQGQTGRLAASGAQAAIAFKTAGSPVTLGLGGTGGGEVLVEKGALIDWGASRLTTFAQGHSNINIEGQGTRSTGGHFTINGNAGSFRVGDQASFQVAAAGVGGLIVGDSAIARFVDSTGHLGKFELLQNGQSLFAGTAAYTADEVFLNHPDFSIILMESGSSLTTKALRTAGGYITLLGGKLEVQEQLKATATGLMRLELGVFDDGRFIARQSTTVPQPAIDLKLEIGRGGHAEFLGGPWGMENHGARAEVRNPNTLLSFSSLALTKFAVIHIFDRANFTCGPLGISGSILYLDDRGTATVGDIVITEAGILTTEQEAHVTATGMTIAEGMCTVQTNSRISLTHFGICSLEKGLLDVDRGSVVSGVLLALGTESFLRGSGNVRFTDTVNNGARIEPGNSPGTLTIDGNFLQTAGKVVLEIDGDTPAQQDQLIITGTANFEGGTIELVFPPDFAPRTGQQFPLLQVTGNLTLPPTVPIVVHGLQPGWQFSSALDPATRIWKISSLSDGVSLPAVPSAFPNFRLTGFAMESTPAGSRFGSGILTGGPAGAKVEIQTSIDLSSSSWRTISRLALDAQGNATFSDLVLPSGLKGFFRARVAGP